jgi:DNA-binding NarL/FixJ family response regulator
MINVAVVEDDARLRRVIAEVFAGSGDCACAGVFRNGAAALEGIPPLHPDVLIMDINLPDISGVECVALLAPQLPNTKIIMLTVYQDVDMIFKALAAGAHGYLAKPVMPEELLEAVRGIRVGGVPMSPPIARKIIDAFLHSPATQTPAPAVGDVGLGTREQQVLQHVINGLSQKEIATHLGISISTVNTYIQRIYEKLHVRSRSAIIARFRDDAEQAKKAVGLFRLKN